MILKGNLCVCKYFIDVLYILSMCWVDFTCVSGSTSQLVLRELLLRINLWVFEWNIPKNNLFFNSKINKYKIYGEKVNYYNI